MNQNDYDTPWKDVLEAYFKEFLEFFFPDAARDVDWGRGYRFLDKELRQVVRDAELGKRFADKLIQIWRKEGGEVWLLIHIEVQDYEEKGFAKRMYVYNYRIFDRYDRDVVSFALLTDSNSTWRPASFVRELWGCRTGITFPVFKMLDLYEYWEELKQNTNPFAVCVMAHFKAKETYHAP